jgi:hypothetical protein
MSLVPIYNRPQTCSPGKRAAAHQLLRSLTSHNPCISGRNPAFQEKELLNERWEQQNGLLVDSQERVIQEVTEEYEGKLGEERLAVEKLQAEREAAHKEYDETRKQMEEDADREIEVLKERCAAESQSPGNPEVLSTQWFVG